MRGLTVPLGRQLTLQFLPVTEINEEDGRGRGGRKRLRTFYHALTEDCVYSLGVRREFSHKQDNLEPEVQIECFLVWVFFVCLFLMPTNEERKGKNQRKPERGLQRNNF